MAACIYCNGTGRRIRERDERGWPIAWSHCPHRQDDELLRHLELFAKGAATPGINQTQRSQEER